MTEKEREKVIRLIAQRLRQLKDDDLLSVDRITLAFLARYSVEGDEDEQRGPLRLLSDGSSVTLAPTPGKRTPRASRTLPYGRMPGSARGSRRPRGEPRRQPLDADYLNALALRLYRPPTDRPGEGASRRGLAISAQARSESLDG